MKYVFSYKSTDHLTKVSAVRTILMRPHLFLWKSKSYPDTICLEVIDNAF